MSNKVVHGRFSLKQAMPTFKLDADYGTQWPRSRPPDEEEPRRPASGVFQTRQITAV